MTLFPEPDNVERTFFFLGTAGLVRCAGWYLRRSMNGNMDRQQQREAPECR
jgi:hypothetical protein